MPDFSPSSAFSFELPEELIAQDPPESRGDSRLLLVEPGRGVVGEKPFVDLPAFLRSGDLLVLNESRVLPARLLTVREDTGGQVEILLVRPVAEARTWIALARPGRRLREGTRLVVRAAANAPVLEIKARRDHGEVLVTAAIDPGTLAENHGVMPLPPYIRRNDDDLAGERGARDRVRYQTVFAAADDTGAGSVAAPTAGLHFSRDLLEDLEKMGVGVARVSLHVGPGTFRAPTVEQMAARRLHREYFRFPAEVAARMAATRDGGGRIIAVGTTSLRVLETVDRLGLDDRSPDRVGFGTGAQDADSVFVGEAVRRDGHHEVCGETRLFLSPPDRVTAVDGLLTNFHLPGSSLLMLVAALAGESTWPGVYDHAVKERFRFYSYGDCMLVMPGLSGSHRAKGI
jgi:S-adenosylmethionine:tRNA ribosyltransferase-isomerase